NDIERVGQTARHGNYLEMLGNLSFGDYFKKEAIAWAWEFFTGVLEIPADKLYISVFKDGEDADYEAYDIWTKEIGVDPAHMVFFGRGDNFWEHGSGPCGPCSEIYFDRGPEKGCGKPDCKVGCDCDRYVEVWNLVFSQFDSDGNGHYTEMENKNIDTGMGLERLACVMQGVDNLFEVDTVQNIMNHVCRIANVKYHTDEKTDVALRVITDHIRSTTFMVGDGVMPSNEGRGYVLRRLLRRAARFGRILGVKDAFLYQVCETVIAENKTAYPELEEKKNYICKVIKNEEESFAKTVDNGFALLTEVLDALAANGGKVVAGEDVFKLSDTYGFPIDLTLEIAAERGFEIDRTRYDELVKEQRQKAREDHLAKAGSSWADNSVKLDAAATVFTGYTDFTAETKVVAIIKGQESVDVISEGEQGIIVLETTPFYAESGGQVGDTGVLSTPSSTFSVQTTNKNEDGHYLHIGTMEEGELRVGDTVSADIDADARKAVMRNHTSAHLLQAALREVLGDHVHQAGQLVNAEQCRFDFSHFAALTAEEIERVEAIVNEKILSAIPVTMQEMAIEEAKNLGAMALFGEKYGDVVRVVSAGDFSVEFCGGTHISNTANIGLFRIVSESSVASGVRRIEAVTGTGVLKLLASYKNSMNAAAKALKLSNAADVAEKCVQLSAELKENDRQIETLNQRISDMKMSAIFDNAKLVNGVKVVAAVMAGTTAQMLRKMGDNIKGMEEPIVAVLAGEADGKGNLVAACSKAAQAQGAHAGKIVQQAAALTGGKGGGRPDSAMAGVGDTAKIQDALNAVEGIVAEMIQK
ncbi:MAG: alanine--tRNA ligase, partial [Ruminococcus sp.]|nr:alanine--tRNA ligase [Ruminococcus sp.]